MLPAYLVAPGLDSVYDCRVKPLRFAGLILYTGYLVHVGLMLIILPWSEAWPWLILRLTPSLALWLDSPAVRGAITAFGALHLLLVVAELVLPPSVKKQL